MASSTLGTRPSDFIKAEHRADLAYCRKAVTVVSGQNLAAGAVVGKVTASGKYEEYDGGAATGVETAAGVLVEAVDASAADAAGQILFRGPAAVGKDGLVWKGDQTTQHKTDAYADLEALGIQVLDSA